MNKTKWATPLVAAALLAGCMHAEFRTGNNPGRTERLNNPFFLWGLVGDNVFDVRQYCPNGVAYVDNFSSFGDYFLFAITLGIYAPRTLELTCNAGHAQGPARVLVGLTAAGDVQAVVTDDGAGHFAVQSIGKKTTHARGLEVQP